MNQRIPIDTPLAKWVDALSSPSTYAGHTIESPPTVRVYQQTASTQDIARQYRGGWFVALADEQTAGRGRLGRAWVAPQGSAVLMSMRWPCLNADRSLDTLAYRVAVAAAETAQRFLKDTDHEVRIKWPNDILVDGRKLAGILIERGDDAAIIGIGLNVSLAEPDLAGLPEELAGHITSLAMLSRPTDRLAVAAELIARCHRCLSSPHDKLLLDEWRCRSTLGYEARFHSAGEDITGTVIDLDPELGLIVRRDSGEIVYLPAATTTVLP
ncbi:MAG: biotin--[acetyl-CoA-carboxylase] ligase [Planctomycetota bacterium]